MARPVAANLGGPFEVVAGEPEPLGRCRVCSRATWRADERGPVHDCCAREGEPCDACRASVGQAASRKRRA